MLDHCKLAAIFRRVFFVVFHHILVVKQGCFGFSPKDEQTQKHIQNGKSLAIDIDRADILRSSVFAFVSRHRNSKIVGGMKSYPVVGNRINRCKDY